MDELRSLFDGAVERVAVPPGDLAAVARRGAARRRNRIVGKVAAASLVAVLAGGSAAILGGQEDRPVPAPVGGGHHRLGARLVPVVMGDPVPSPELAASDDLADARAVTVAFHALLAALPDYDLEYEGLRRTDEGWEATFLIAPAIEPIRHSFGGEPGELLREIQTSIRRRNAVVAALRAEVRRVREKSRERTDRDVEKQLERASDDLQRQLERAEAELRELLRDVRPLRNRVKGVGTHEVVVTVVERDGMVVVERVDPGSAAPGSVARATGYAEAAAEIDAWGADYYDASFLGEEEGVLVVVRPFWTGPLEAPYEELCRAQVLDAGGRVVWTQPRPPVPARFDSAPDSEDARDGGEIRFGVNHDGDVRSLSLRMLCEWRPQQ